MTFHACMQAKTCRNAIIALAAATFLLAGCGSDGVVKGANAADRADADKASFKAELTLRPETPFELNPYLLGNNIQWVDRGDEMLDGRSLELASSKIDRLKPLGISALRYPGGSLADLYHWKDGMGGRGQRKSNERFHGGDADQVLLGTREFLALCAALGAEPVITVNVITGTPEEAADWVRQVNVTGFAGEGPALPKVRYWEIGNEPYLVDDNQKNLAITPEAFARRAATFIKAMKAVDPTIAVGIPLRSDKLGGVPATPMPGYNDKVLAGVDAPIDFVSVHNAYYPFVYAEVPGKTEMYLAAMAASTIVAEDFDATRKQLEAHRKEARLPIALTEYNALFTLQRGATDGYLASLAGGLFVADLLMTLGKRSDLLMANYWSLSGNWFFGALEQNGEPRVSYHVLEGFNRLWQGKGVDVQVVAPAFDSPDVGFASARRGVPLVNAIATTADGVTRVLVLNKHPVAAGEVSLVIPGLREGATITKQELYADDFFAQRNVAWSEFTPVVGGAPVQLTLYPHSLTLIEIR